jgi:hypothetical protein
MFLVDSAEHHGCHPRIGAPLFIARLGYGQQRLINLLLAGGVRMTASPLYYVATNPQLALFPGAKNHLGLALDPCVHLRQLPFARRAPSFRALPWGAGLQAFDPDHDPIDAAELAALAITPLELQRNRGATLLQTSAHLTGPVGTRGRELDLLLARAGIAHFRAQRMDEPPQLAANPIRREIYATIAIEISQLRSPAVRSALCEAYLELAADGLWVKLAGFDERAARTDIRAGGAFLAELRDAGRSVLCDQPGQLHLGLLADGLSAAVGIAEGERFRFPTNWQNQAPEKKRPGRRRSAYNAKLLRSYLLGGEAATRAFAEAACSCGRHPRNEPPRDGHIAEEHAAIIRCLQAHEALDGELQDRREWVLAAAAMAMHVAHDIGVDYLAPAVFEELFIGLDRGDDRQLQARYP